jgi:hypothetical protein
MGVPRKGSLWILRRLLESHDKINQIFVYQSSLSVQANTGCSPARCCTPSIVERRTDRDLDGRGVALSVLIYVNNMDRIAAVKN